MEEGREGGREGGSEGGKGVYPAMPPLVVKEGEALVLPKQSYGFIISPSQGCRLVCRGREGGREGRRSM